ncbi:MAG: ATP-binding protein [Solirubrobacteraceae bacterium]
MLPASLNESYPAVAASVPRARTAISQFAGAAGAAAEQIEAVRWASSEALTNVVLHAYGDGDGEIHVTAAVTAGELWVLVADDGRGLGGHSDNAGLGLGLSLMAQLTDDLVIARRAGGGTEVRMRFALVPAAAPRGGDQARGSLACARRPASPRFSTTK